MKPVMLAFACFAATGVAHAQQAVYCDWAARADAIVEPWSDHTRTFANGNVRLALLDTIEPAAGAFHILILSPPHDELGARQCVTLGMGDGIGFSGADFASLEADYDPAAGLMFTMRVEVFDGTDFAPAVLRFTLNQATGAIDAQIHR